MAILLFVLLLWAGAISLFYHQWGKIRGIDDYQPDYVHANMTIHPNPFPEEGSEIGVSTYLFKRLGTSQCPRTDLNKRSLPRPKTITA